MGSQMEKMECYPASKFYRDLQDYKKNFGSINGNFGLGNEHLHALTIRTKYKLRVHLGYVKSKGVYAHYSKFSIDVEGSKHTFKLGAFCVTAGDSLSRHNDRELTAFDRDNDTKPFRELCQRA
ncbi:hypothetical protein RRG08_039596 [Elysia crispata]|uniref:Fibrinogen C-terminal domain-containing protein n=1 Tax=Elysia crispata TaxID=231223 RepID=A0AAE1AJY1_9GAST|nr:hypothetical protein RRG08_039596 [Elysia crispata]